MRKTFEDARDYLMLYEIAADPSILPYDPAHPAKDGEVEIGTLDPGDGSISKLSICPDGQGYAIKIEVLAFPPGEDGEHVLLPQERHPVSLVYSCKELRPASSAGEGYSSEVFATVEAAYNGFLEYVYTTRRTERYDEICKLADDVISGYVDAWGAPFADFKHAFENAVAWRDYDKVLDIPYLGNAMLFVRYPFLIPRSAYLPRPEDKAKETGGWEDGRDSSIFDHSWFDSFPSGWQRRFGLEMCEDIRNQLFDEDGMVWKYRMCEFYVDDIKEKFGGLRFYYSGGAGRIDDVVEAYCAISEHVCIKCGRADKLRFVTSGWLSPYCYDEILDGKTKRKLRDKLERELYPGGESVPWDESWQIDQFAEFACVLETTQPGPTSAQMREMLVRWEWDTYSGGEKRRVNKAVGLLDGTRAPNGEVRHIVGVIESLADDIGKLEGVIASSYAGTAWHELVENHPELVVPEWFGNPEDDRC